MSMSSVASLVLSLSLNLVPIALLANVSTRNVSIYTLMSDVVTVIPLGIKGIEPISMGQQSHRCVVIRFTTASSGELSESPAMVMYTADCGAHDDILPAGIAFLVMGIALEFLAKYHPTRRELL